MKCKETLALLLKNASILLMNPKTIYNNYIDRITRIGTTNCNLDTCLKAVETLNGLIELMKESDLIALEKEYTRLFISNYPSLPCPLYESAYVGKDRFLAEPTVINDINLILSRLNMELNKGLYRFPDSLPVELELAYILVSIEPQDPQTITPLINILLVKHLSKWLPLISSCIRQNTTNNYYMKLSQLLAETAECIKDIY